MLKNKRRDRIYIWIYQMRKNIDRVDAEIRKLFVERMTLADQVACIKAETEDKIYKPDREEIIIKKQTEE